MTVIAVYHCRRATVYLDPAEAPNLIADCAARFPGGAMKLDCVRIGCHGG